MTKTVHSDDGRLPRSGIRGMIAAMSYRVPGMPLMSVTGCGRLRRYVPSTSPVPERVTCPACRDWRRAGYTEAGFREMAARFAPSARGRLRP